MQGEQSNTQENSDRNQQSFDASMQEVTFDELLSKIEQLMEDL